MDETHLNDLFQRPQTSAEYFKRADRAAAIERLQHFIRFSDAALLLSGPSGSGKTCVLEEFVRAADQQSWQLAVIDSDEIDPGAGLAALVRQKWGLEADEQGHEVHHLLNSLIAEDQGYLLILDNAGRLPGEQLDWVLQLYRASVEDPARNVHIVLASDPGFHPRLSLLLGEGAALHTVGLPPLSLQEVGEYVRMKLSQSGVRRQLSLEHSDIDAAWRVSQGLPAAINRWLAEKIKQHQLDAKRAQDRTSMAPPGRKGSALVISGILLVVVLLVVLVMGYLYRDDVDLMSPADPGDKSTAELEDLVPSENGRAIMLPEPEPEPESQLVQQLQDTRAEVAKEPLSADVVEEAVPAEVDESVAPVYTEAEMQLLKQPDGGYVLQVLAGASHEAVEKFVRQQANRSSLLVYTAQRKGEPWRVVVIAGFDSLSEAKGAIAGLPDRQKKQGAWPRPIAKVKAEIEEYHRN